VIIGLGIFLAAWNKYLSIGLFLSRSDILKKNVTLAVCVLSAQGHFEQRKSIRHSWMSDIDQIRKIGKEVTVKFVVGQKSCPIHPDNRIDPFGCNRWEPSVPENPHEVIAFNVAPQAQGTNENSFVIQLYLYVKVMSDIVLKRLGLLNQLINVGFQQNSTLQIILYDAVTDDEIAQAAFPDHRSIVDINGYGYRPVKELFLPKGFEFIVVAQGPDSLEWPSDIALEGSSVQSSHNNIIFTQIVDSAGRVLPRHRHKSYVPAASIIFSLSDVNSLQLHINRIPQVEASWERTMASTSISLNEEIQRHDDVMLLDIQDVYRNLPLKVAQCHEWFNRHTVPEYVMKTDDDCFINLPEIVRLLQELPNDVPTWWGSFRQYWTVERHGKWKEDLYSSSVYPDFACGSGSVLSSSLSSWLSSNAHMLQPFQGEDVSVGVWLAGLRLRQVHDERWRCDLSCRDGLLSLPELTPDQVVWHWNNSRFCSGPCNSC
ncbi:hypothetical protein EGW08_010090, partial [Elysia chlorotica]